MTDKIHRFIFDTHGIRGEFVDLSASAQRVLKDHNYPAPIATLLQQCSAISVLLATTLKFEGQISLQLQTPGALKMLVVQTTHNLGFRGLARLEDNETFENLSFKDITSGGQMVITIAPKKGKRYQGIVPLEGDNIQECIEQYFNQSEQLKTRIWLFNNHTQVRGLFLQALPDMTSQDAFEHLEYLSSTLTSEECLTVDTDILLHRLFHQESIKGMSIEEVKFQCGCSKKKMLNSICLLPEEEINEILQTKGEISARCEFCLDQFKFKEIDIKLSGSLQGNSTQH